jgi:hypothetical protein
VVTAPNDSPADDLDAVVGPARLGYFTPVHDQPILADRKAMFILGASGLMVSVLLFFSGSLGTLVRGRGAGTGLAAAAAVCAVALLVLAAAVMAYYAYTRPVPAMPPNFAWFRSIAGTSRDGYEHGMRALDHPAALRGILHYNYSIACQAACKFRLVNRSLKCLRVAIPLWMLLLLVLAVWG